jgi:uncharacterized membrane protein YedE/YeeE
VDLHPFLFLIVVSLFLGTFAGYLMHRSDFCIAGMFRDLFLFRRTAPLKRLVLTVLASAAIFELVRQSGGLADQPFPLLGPPSLVNLFGGLVFGVGMVLAGGCVVGSLYKLGAGSLLSLVALGGLIAGSAFYAEFHGGWAALAGDLRVFGDAVTLPQLFAMPTTVVVVPLVAFGGVVVYRWASRGAFVARLQPDGYVQPWQAGIGLALVGTASYVLVGMPMGITTAYAKAGAYVESWVAPQHVAGLAYLQAEGLRYVPPFSDVVISGGAGPRLDAIAAIQFPLIGGIVLGSMLSAVLLREWRLHYRMPWRQYASALVGGFVMGMAARMAPACNVWHLLGGLPILALQSVLFLIGLFPGAWLGSRLLTRFVLR